MTKGYQSFDIFFLYPHIIGTKNNININIQPHIPPPLLITYIKHLFSIIYHVHKYVYIYS